MSKNLKQRIEDLMIRTNSNKVLEACKDAIIKMNKYEGMKLQETAAKNLEDSIIETFIVAISEESAIVEFADIAIQNLGVRSGVSKLWFEDLKTEGATTNVSLKYVVENLTKSLHQPEWLIYEEVTASLKPFDFDPNVKAVIEKIENNVLKFSEDIKIHRAIYEAKTARQNFILPSLQKEIDGYLQTKSPSARSILVEKLNKFLFDPIIKKLYNIIVENAQGFEIKATSNDAFIRKVYSPVIVTENAEIFVVHGKVFKKVVDEISTISEEELAALPAGFVQVAKFINQPNVEISESGMKIFSRDKKVEIFENESGVAIKVNEATVSSANFDKIYLNSGIFNVQEIAVLRDVKTILENWETICEVDCVKSIFSKAYPNRRADVFRCGDKTHINTVDVLMKEDIFYPNCTAHQSRNKVLEFVNYDLTLTFKDLMTPEETKISTLQENKNEYLKAIEYLETRKNLLESQDPEIRNTPEIKELVEAISEEITSLKKEYFDNQTQINTITKVQEGVGASVGDEVEYLKKKQ